MVKLKVCFIAVILCLAATRSFGQIKFGVRGGLNLSNVSISGRTLEPDYIIDSRAGFFIGPTALLQTSLKGLEFDVSALYDQRGVDTESKGLLGGYQYKTTTTHKQISVPVNVRYHLLRNNRAGLYLFVGPQLGINVGQKENIIDSGVIVFNDASFSINAGVGLMVYDHLQISANYNIVCKKDAEIWNSLGHSYSVPLYSGRFNAWQFSIGYYL